MIGGCCIRLNGFMQIYQLQTENDEEEEKEDVVDAERRLGGKAMHIYVSASMMF